MGPEKEDIVESDSSELAWVRGPIVLFLFQRGPASGVNWIWVIGQGGTLTHDIHSPQRVEYSSSCHGVEKI
jgi:hypothetical protein